MQQLIKYIVMGINDKNEGKRVGIILIIVLFLLLLVTMLEFKACYSGERRHNGWDKTHLIIIKPMKINVNDFIFYQKVFYI